MKLTYEIEFTSHRCGDCGHYYLVETNCYSFNCPYCAPRELGTKRDEIGKLYKRIRGYQSHFNYRRNKTERDHSKGICRHRRWRCLEGKQVHREVEVS